MSLSPQMTVAVCGAGAMGVGIVQVAAQAGHPVIVLDTNAAALTRGETALRDSLSALVKRGRLDATTAEAISARVAWSTDVVDLAPAGLVIEAIVEDETIKADLFDRIEVATCGQTILATNTSSLSVTRLGASRKRPAGFLGLHFFNPAPVMKLVEVIGGPATDVDLLDRAEALMTAWGKAPVRVRDVPGFIVNRVARPFYAEGFRALSEGVAAPETIDALFRSSASFRMGPLELADMIGHDVNYAVARSVFDAYFGQTRFTPQLAQGRLVDGGMLGRKSGRGVYDHGARVDEARPASAAPAPGRMVIGPNVPSDLAARLAAAGAVSGSAPKGWVEVDGVLVTFGDGRMAASRAAEIDRPVALLDWIQPGAEAVGFAVSSDAAMAAVQGLITAAGWRGYALADRPGMIVLRTLAQLANAAGDAVRDGVSDAAGVDQAMRLGANYPFGPLAWADRFGQAALVAVLTRIAEETGDAMYRPSEYFRRFA